MEINLSYEKARDTLTAMTTEERQIAMVLYLKDIKNLLVEILAQNK